MAYPESGVTKVTAAVYALDGTEICAEESVSASGGTATYEKSGISAGMYAVTFRFYATDSSSGAEILVGAWTEYAGVASGVTSTSTDTSKNTISTFDSTYTITYNWNGGRLVSGETAQASYTRHDSVTLPISSQVAKTGYTFAGWYDNAEFTGDAVTQIPSDTTGEKSFWAKWKANTYTVCYHKNTSEIDTVTENQLLTYDANESLSTLSALGLSRTDAAFVGWTDSASGTAATTMNGTSLTDGASGIFNMTAEQGATVDLYAVWKYTITFSGNKGASHPTSVTGNTAGSSYTFSADTTLYAQWSLNTYNIAYTENSGTWAGGYTKPSSYTIESNAVTLPTASNIMRTGYSFAGWYDNESLTGSATTSIASGSTGNKTFYAKWTANKYTITLNANGGSGGTESVTATYDKAMPTLTTTNPPSNHPAALGSFKRCGYTLDGFYDAASGGTKYYDANGTSVKNWDKTSATTLYAQWTALGVVFTSGSSTGMELTGAIYVFSQDLSFSTGTAGDSGITIGAGSVTFYIEEGVTITATSKAGANAGCGYDNPNATEYSTYGGYGGAGAGGGGAVRATQARLSELAAAEAVLSTKPTDTTTEAEKAA